MSKQYHYFYIIVNKVNRKFYYGVHSTNDLNDGYMGSGTVLKAAIEKHGIENFVKTILGFFDTRDELMTIEREFLNERFLKEHKDECYNIHPGGYGGSLPGWKMSPESIEKMSNTRKGNCSGEQNGFYGKRHTDEWRKQHSETLKGHTDSLETRKKRSESMKGKNKGKSHPNPMKGKHWHKDEETGKRVYY